MKLLLFDIDSTLVRVARPVNARLIDLLAREYLGHREELEGYELHGKTDPLIIRELCSIAGADHSSCAPEMERMIIDHWREHLDETTVEVLPGVYELLDDLASRDDVALAVLTGNMEEGAGIKLGVHGLDEYFPFGAYGSDAERRGDLPPIALERAALYYDRAFPPESVVIIGDSNRDIECAKEWSLHSLAVATGGLSADELRTFGPDAVVESLFDRAWLDAFIDGRMLDD